MNLADSDIQHCCHSTLAQQAVFHRFLRNPTMFADKWCKRKSRSNLAGPMRGEKIQELADILTQSFVILQFERSHEKEISAVAIINQCTGNLVAIYGFESQQYYETHCQCDSFHVGNYCNAGARTIVSSGTFNEHLLNGAEENDFGDNTAGISKAENAWIFQAVNIKGDCVMVAQPNYALFHLFQGLLSPAEISATLLHALSSDSRSIYEFVVAVDKNLDGNFDSDGNLEYFDEMGDFSRAEFLEWEQTLANITYPSANITYPSKTSKKRSRN